MFLFDVVLKLKC